MTKPFVLKEYIFSFIFWLVLTIVLWCNFQTDTEKYLAMIQAVIVAVSSVYIYSFSDQQTSSKGFTGQKMKQFLIQAIMLFLF
jgi:hypothetical protein